LLRHSKEEFIMNATDTKYNPFHAATAAAFSELSSEQAQRFYSLKAQKDIQNVLNNSVTLFCWVFQLAELTYAMGAQCRAWCAELETNAQAPTRTLPLLTLAQVEAEAPWEIEADYEFVEFTPSVAAQAFTSPVLLLASPRSSTVFCGSVWNPAPKDMHAEVSRLHERERHMLMQSPVIEQPAPEPVPTLEEVDELATALDVPGAPGRPKRERKPKTSTSKAVAQPKGTRARAKAKTGAK
jgi:hypothetical protein